MALEFVRQSIQKGKVSLPELQNIFSKRTSNASHLNAFTFINNDKENISLNQFNPSNYNNVNNRLFGLPVGVKDNFCTKTMPTTCSSRMLQSFHPPYNATVVEKLLQQGAILWGKCNMDEFAMGCGSCDSIFGPVKNPWNPNHITGGSSGGSAAAVSAGLVLAALGSDTGGSTRNPAAHCGVVGLKPTYGAVSRHGLIPLVNALDVPGILTNSVEDCAEIFYYLAGLDPMDSTTTATNYLPAEVCKPNRSLKIGIPKEYLTTDTQEFVLNYWDKIASALDNAGHSVQLVSLPHTQYSIKCYSLLCCAEVASNMARYDGIRYGHRANSQNEDSCEQLFARTRAEAFNEVVRGRILAGNYFLLRKNYDKYYSKALQLWRLIFNDFQTIFNNCKMDLLLTPVTPADALSLTEFMQQDNRTRTTSDDVFTQPTNLAGLPAIVLPIGLSPRQLPIGIQLIANKYQEPLLFSVGKQIQDLVNFKPLFSIQNIIK